jgi:flavorubredoxin
MSDSYRHPETLPRAIAPNIFWLGGCLAVEMTGREVHGHSSAFLVRGEDKALLVDTGSPQDWTQVSAALDLYLEGRQLDYLLPTHPELPHAGNLGRLLEKYPAALAVGDVRDYHAYYPAARDRLVRAEPGAQFDLGGGSVFTVIDAVIRDLPNTVWGYESSQQVLFVSDGLSHTHHPELAEDEALHLPGECGLLTSEIGEPPTLDQAAFFAGRALYWTRFVNNSEPLFERLRRLLDEFPTRIIAPGHGNVVDQIERVLPVIERSHRDAYAEFHPGPAAAG